MLLMVCSSHEERQIRDMGHGDWSLSLGSYLATLLTLSAQQEEDRLVYVVSVGYAEENRPNGRFVVVQSAGLLGQRAVSGKQGSWDRDPR